MFWVSPSAALERYASAVVGRLLHPVSSATAVSRGPGGYRDTFHEAAPVELAGLDLKKLWISNDAGTSQ